MLTKWKFVAGLLLLAGIATALLVGSFGLYESAAATAESPDADATLTVAHYAPFAGDVAATSVSVVVNGSEVITDFTFAETVSGISLPAGTYTVEIVPTGTVTPAIVQTLTVEADTDYTVAAIGGANNWPLELSATIDDNTPFTSTAKVRITHFAPFAELLDDTKVDICTDAGAALLSDVPYKGSSGYLSLDPGIYDLNIAVAGSGCGFVALDLPPFALAAGQVADIYAIGLLVEGDLGLQVSQTGLQARISVAHFAPFADTIAGTSVTVKLDGSDVLTDFVFPTVSPYLSVPLGEYLVEVVPTGASDPAITGTAVVSAFTDFTFAAIGDEVNQPLDLMRYEDDNVTPPDTGKARVRIAHLASVSDDLAQTQVDVCDATTSNSILQNFEYGQMVTLELDAGVYDIFLAAAGTSCASPLIDIPTFVLQDGDIVYVYAVGNIVNIMPTVVSVPPLSLAAQVSIAHFAPFASTPAGTEVTVQIDGSDFLTGFVYPQITPYVALPAGSYGVAVIPTAPTAASDPAITGTLTISEGVDYTVAAVGDGTNQPLALKAFVDDNSQPPEGKARIRAAHLAPFADTLDGTTVDLCAAVGAKPLVDDFKFGEDATLLLDEGLYTTVFIGAADPDCSAVVLPIPPFVAADGAVGYVYALGGANDIPLSVLAQPEEVLAQILRFPYFYSLPQ
jgi:hypothetical protein